MKYPTAPLNNYIVRLTRKYYDTVAFDSGITLHIDPAWHPEEFAMLEAQVVSVPHGITQRHDYKGFQLNASPGDKIMIRYDVVFSYKDQPERDSIRYKNLFLWQANGSFEELWVCDVQKVFAVVEKSGNWRMQSDYVRVHLTQQDRQPQSCIIMPDAFRYGTENHLAVVVASSESAKVVKGQKIYIKPGVAQRYEIDRKTFFIIRQSHILAIA